MSKPKPRLLLFVGDLHVGAPEALAVKESVANRQQKWLWEQWQNLIKRTREAAREYDVWLMLGGDLVDLPGEVDCVENAIDLLRPLVNVAREVYGVYGTPYHVGEDGGEDRTVYGQLGVRGDRRRQHHWLDIDGAYMSWAHHGLGVGKNPYTALNGHKRMAEDLYWQAKEVGGYEVGYAVRHHAHVVPPGAPVYWKNVWVSGTPCWVFPDAFAGKVAPGRMPTIGATVLRDGRLEVWRYAIPESLA